jgi:hypothetical protein
MRYPFRMYSTQSVRMYVHVLSNNALGAGVVRGESVVLFVMYVLRTYEHVQSATACLAHISVYPLRLWCYIHSVHRTSTYVQLKR